MTSTFSIPTLETERLILRAPDARDMAAMLAFFQSERAEFYGGPMDASAAWHKFSAYVGQWTLRGYGFFAVTLKDGGDTIGMVGPHQPAHFDEPEMSWLLASDAYEGKGYAAEACRAVLNHLFNDLGWSSAISFIDTGNVASRALALRLGAKLDADTPAQIANCESYRHFPVGGAI